MQHSLLQATLDRTSHEATASFLQQVRCDPLATGQPLSALHNYGLFVLSRDIENGFMNVLHAEIIEAWEQIANIMVGKGYTSAWVSPCKAKQAGSFQQLPHALWTHPRNGRWVRIPLLAIRHVLLFACKHMHIRFGTAPGCQTKGITMGSGLGGAVFFRLVLVVHEMRAVLGNQPATEVVSKSLPGSHASCMRFMDDVRVFIVAPLTYSLQGLQDAANAFLTFVYPPIFP